MGESSVLSAGAHRVVRVARVLIPIAMVLGVALVGIAIAHRGVPTQIGIVSVEVGPDEGPYSPLQLAFALLPAAIVLYSMFRLWRLFDSFARAEYFSSQAVGHLRGFAAAYAASVAMAGVVDVVLRLWRAPGGPIDIDIDGEQLWHLLAALTFFVVAYVLNEARRNAEELGKYF